MMNTKESSEIGPTPGAEELLRITSPTRSRTNEQYAGSREAFVALGETLESAIIDFDWKRIAAKLENEVAAQSDWLRPRDSRSASSRNLAWVGLSTAMVLLIALTLGLTLSPSSTQLGIAQRNDTNGNDKNVDLTVPAIDSWSRPPTASETNSLWNDEIDVKLAATQRALNQGRDPWVGDEPALSEVFAQIGELTAGLEFEPF